MADTRAIVALLPASEESPPRGEPVRLACRLAGEAGHEVTVIVAGPVAEAEAVAAAALGAPRVWAVGHPSFAERFDAEQLLGIFRDALSCPDILAGRVPDLVLMPAGEIEEEVAARLAAGLDGVALGRCLDIVARESGFLVRRSAYGGRVRVLLEATASPCVAVVASAGTAPVSAGAPRQGQIRSFRSTVALPAAGHVKRVVGAAAQERRLERARVIVSGGRGMGGAEGFASLRELADCLGGAVGGSLPAADAGWIPVSRQIGQSGKYVTPEVYIAVGLSGTIQHVAGIDSRARIVALNSDPDAAIFAVAELGAVCDWRELLPALVHRLKTVEATGTA
ncbi:MAG: electron transfer flavoprotein subunit alpha/FixB family protein [Candidatus Rokubacteria bacterium]|nr:electron transfer flavoprotein subunit alpha/FixB family protein [Candidatus Rokubacteria bacterium]MBI3108064.1 electron transfer flavoprotein subunit alpha/FixB family protein [Candidatus Rokubacteria bacterium]